MVKNPNWQKADLQSVWLEKQNPLVTGWGLEPGTSGLQHQRPKPLGHANIMTFSLEPSIR